jgi:hypothetical protein
MKRECAMICGITCGKCFIREGEPDLPDDDFGDVPGCPQNVYGLSVQIVATKADSVPAGEEDKVETAAPSERR